MSTEQPDNKKGFKNPLLLMSRLDVIGNSFNFNFGDQQKFKTPLGGFVSLALIGVISFFFYDALKRLFDTTSPDVTISQYMTSKVDVMDLYKDKFTLVTGAYKDMIIFDVNKLPKFFTPLVYAVKQENLDLKNGVTTLDKVDVIRMVPCRDLVDKSTIEYFFLTEQESLITNSFGLCPNITANSTWKIGGKFNDPPSLIIQIRYFPCSLPNPLDCATALQMQSLEYKFGLIRKGFDPASFENPVQHIPSFDRTIHLHTGLEKRYDIDFQKNEIWDDYKELQGQELKTEYYSIYRESIDSRPRVAAQIYCTMAQINGSMCAPYLTIQFWATGVTQKIQRKYGKLISTLGEMGGNAEFMIIFFTLSYCWYNNAKIKEHMDKQVLLLDNHAEAAKYLYPEKDFSQDPKNNKIEVLSQGQSAFADVVLQLKKNKVAPLKSKTLTNGKTVVLNNDTLNKVIQFMTRKKDTISELHEATKEKTKKENMNNTKSVINQVYRDKEDGFNLFSMSDKMQILESIYFKDFHNRLIPLAILNMKKKIFELRKSETQKFKSASTIQEEGSLKTLLSIEEAYVLLLQQKPDNEFDLLIKNFLLNNLPEQFKKFDDENQDKDKSPDDEYVLNGDNLHNGKDDDDDEDDLDNAWKLKIPKDADKQHVGESDEKWPDEINCDFESKQTNNFGYQNVDSVNTTEIGSPEKTPTNQPLKKISLFEQYTEKKRETLIQADSNNSLFSPKNLSGFAKKNTMADGDPSKPKRNLSLFRQEM